MNTAVCNQRRRRLLFPLSDVPSPGKLLHPGTERNILCQCFQRGVSLPDTHGSSDFFRYDDSAEIVDSSHNTGCFHFVPPVFIFAILDSLTVLFAVSGRLCIWDYILKWINIQLVDLNHRIILPDVLGNDHIRPVYIAEYLYRQMTRNSGMPGVCRAFVLEGVFQELKTCQELLRYNQAIEKTDMEV